jgi:drug/metabolite transporter (DMT)-like permease
MDRQTTGLVFTVLAAALFGTLGIFGKGAATTELSVTTLLAGRFVAATAVLWGVLSFRSGSSRLPGRVAGLELGLGLTYGIMSIAYFESLAWLSAGVAAVLLFTYPVQVTVASAVALDEPMTVPKGVALLAATSGVVLVVLGDDVVVGGTGVVLVGVASVCYTLYTMGTRAVIGDVAPLVHVAYVFLGVTATVLVYGLTAGSLTVPNTPESWLVIAGITVVGTLVPLVLFTEGLARIEASRASILSTSEPLTTVLLGIVLLDETLTVSVGLGALLILAGVVCTSPRAERVVRGRLVPGRLIPGRLQRYRTGVGREQET